MVDYLHHILRLNFFWPEAILDLLHVWEIWVMSVVLLLTGCVIFGKLLTVSGLWL